MTAFGIYKGIRIGVLDAKYRSYADKMKAAVTLKSINSDMYRMPVARQRSAIRGHLQKRRHFS